MTIWIDAQLSPHIADWRAASNPMTAIAVVDLGFRDSEDLEIFSAAKEASCVVMTKDQDFVMLLERFGPPPQIIWLTCGNTSNSTLRKILDHSLQEAVEMLKAGEPVVEIRSV